MHGFILSESTSGVVVKGTIGQVLVATDDGTWAPGTAPPTAVSTADVTNNSVIPGLTLDDALLAVSDYMAAGVDTSAVVNTSPIPGVTLADVLVVINDYMLAHP